MTVIRHGGRIESGDALSFIFGALFLALGLLVQAGDATRLLSAWLAPAVIIGLGMLLLFVGWQSTRTGGTDGLSDEA